MRHKRRKEKETFEFIVLSQYPKEQSFSIIKEMKKGLLERFLESLSK